MDLMFLFINFELTHITMTSHNVLLKQTQGIICALQGII